MVVAPPGSLIPSRRLDAFLEDLAQRPPAPEAPPGGAPPHRHQRAPGGAPAPGRRRTAGRGLGLRPVFPAGAPVALKPGDRLVVRNLSPAFTWGGGQVLHVNPGRHKRRQDKVMAGLKTLEQGTPAERPALLSGGGRARGPKPPGAGRPAALGPRRPRQPVECPAHNRARPCITTRKTSAMSSTATARALEEESRQTLKSLSPGKPPETRALQGGAAAPAAAPDGGAPL